MLLSEAAKWAGETPSAPFVTSGPYLGAGVGQQGKTPHQGMGRATVRGQPPNLLKYWFAQM